MKKLRILSLILITGIIMQSQYKQLLSRLDSIKTVYNVVGMSVVLIENNKITFSEGFGYKDLENQLPVDKNTKYRIASVSKMITTTALMKLYEEGRFKLTDDVSDYLGFKLRNPNFPDQVITFESLLSHTSSLREGDTYDKFLMTSYRAETPPALKELFEGEFKGEDIWSKTEGPDKGFFEYANINFGIAGTIIEKLSGKRFDEYVRENIFKPMGVTADFNTYMLPEIKDLSAIYRKEEGKWVAQTDNYKGIKPAERKFSGYVPGFNGLPFGPQGSCRASAEDLAAFVIMNLNGGKYNGKRIIKKETLETMYKPVWIADGKNANNYRGIFSNYALGNHTTGIIVPGEKLTGHSGDAYGLVSGMYFSTDKKFGIIFMVNGGEWADGTYSGWFNVEEAILTACYKAIQK